MDTTTILRDPKTMPLAARLVAMYTRNALPETGLFRDRLLEARRALLGENRSIRPRNRAAYPGGLIYLKQDVPVWIIPDLHARREFLLNLLFYQDGTGLSNLEKLGSDLLQIVCVGDGVHAEGRGKSRWQAALREYEGGYREHDNMDEEMQESMGLMEMVMLLKSAFPDNFHFLKGNHENITSTNMNGNHPFRKFALESPMVTAYVEQFYGDAVLASWDMLEKLLPILAAGKDFLVSHAEPRTFYERETILEYRRNPDAIEGLTWTDNGQAESGSVQKMLAEYIGRKKGRQAYHFCGHRPVSGLFARRAAGRCIQLHNPNLFVVAALDNPDGFFPEKDIFVLPDRTEKIIDRYGRAMMTSFL